MVVAAVSFLAVFVLLGFGVPLAVSLGLSGFVGLIYIIGPKAAGVMVAQTAFDNAHSYTLAVLPLFLFMANLISRAGIVAALFDASAALLGRLRGGLAMSTIAGCAGFGAVCGSSVATAATMGSVTLPQMKRFNYDDGLAAGSVAAGGTLGILIPPSILLVIYGEMTEQSIGDLFLAGILPGLLGALLYMIAIAITVRLRPDMAPPFNKVLLLSRWAAIRGVWPITLLFLVVIGGIYGGIFSATEAAAVGAAGAMMIGIVRREVGFRDIIVSAYEAVALTAALLFVLIGATLLANVMIYSGLASALVDIVTISGIPPIGAILVIVLIYLILGCVFDSLALMLLTVPLFAPIVSGMGFDLIWFGIIVAVAIEVGMISPPIGMNLFIIRSIRDDISLSAIYRGIVPFLAADAVRLAILIFVPGISLLLPHTMR